MDSVFPVPYGKFKRRADHPTGTELNEFIHNWGGRHTGLAAKPEGGPGLAAWFVSNCHSRSGREEKVKQLKQFLGVDVFGSGGCSDPGLTCPRTHNRHCLQMLNTKYKVGTGI